MARFLTLDLVAPLMSFGGVAIDQIGPVRPFPAASMLTGLIGNALGWDWDDADSHQALQDRLVFGAAEMREGSVITDTQNAQLAKADRGWTTRGVPEGRAGASYDAPHRRRRDFQADRAVRIVLALEPPEDAPTLDAIRSALMRPARPLFLGRKACLPSRPILPVDTEMFDADTVKSALARVAPGRLASWPAGQGAVTPGDRAEAMPDLRVWTLGLHGGTRGVVEGRLPGAVSGGDAPV